MSTIELGGIIIGAGDHTDKGSVMQYAIYRHAEGVPVVTHLPKRIEETAFNYHIDPSVIAALKTLQLVPENHAVIFDNATKRYSSNFALRHGSVMIVATDVMFYTGEGMVWKPHNKPSEDSSLRDIYKSLVAKFSQPDPITDLVEIKYAVGCAVLCLPPINQAGQPFTGNTERLVGVAGTVEYNLNLRPINPEFLYEYVYGSRNVGWITATNGGLRIERDPFVSHIHSINGIDRGSDEFELLLNQLNHAVRGGPEELEDCLQFAARIAKAINGAYGDLTEDVASTAKYFPEIQTIGRWQTWRPQV